MEGRLSELDEYAVEQAVSLVEKGLPATVTFLTMGPARAVDGLRKALAMGGDDAVHVSDEALHGSDALATSLVLARAIERIGFDLVVTGWRRRTRRCPSSRPCSPSACASPSSPSRGELSVTDGSCDDPPDSDTAWTDVAATLPALVSVTDETGEARYPSFKAIMAGKKKKSPPGPSRTSASSPPRSAGRPRPASSAPRHPRPPRQAGSVLTDDGDGAAQIADFLVTRKLL